MASGVFRRVRWCRVARVRCNRGAVRLGHDAAEVTGPEGRGGAVRRRAVLAVDLGVAASLGVLWRGRRTRQRALRRSGLVVQRRRGLGGVEGTARRRLGVASALPARRPVRELGKDGNGVAP